MLGGVGEALVTAGVLVLAFVAYQLWGTGFYEARHQRSLLQSFESSARLTGEASPGRGATPTPTTGESGDAPVIRGASSTT
ncbi:MAG: hypothetical protein ACRDKW_07010, partial [Actinomycetota bacterium]